MKRVRIACSSVMAACCSSGIFQFLTLIVFGSSAPFESAAVSRFQPAGWIEILSSVRDCLPREMSVESEFIIFSKGNVGQEYVLEKKIHAKAVNDSVYGCYVQRRPSEGSKKKLSR